MYCDQDEKKEYPLQKNDLDNVVVFQYTKEKVRGVEVVVPANHMNPIGIYTPDEFEQHKAEGGLFDRMKLLYEVWNTPKPKEVEPPKSDEDPAT